MTTIKDVVDFRDAMLTELYALDPAKPFTLNHTAGIYQPGPYEPRHLPLIIKVLEDALPSKPYKKVKRNA